MHLYTGYLFSKKPNTSLCQAASVFLVSRSNRISNTFLFPTWYADNTIAIPRKLAYERYYYARSSRSFEWKIFFYSDGFGCVYWLNDVILRNTRNIEARPPKINLRRFAGFPVFSLGKVVSNRSEYQELWKVCFCCSSDRCLNRHTPDKKNQWRFGLLDSSLLSFLLLFL